MSNSGTFNLNAGGIFYTANSNKSVGDPSDQYTSIRPLWDRARAVVQGQRFSKAFDTYVDTMNFNNLLLPFSPSMTQNQYDFYRAEAELPGLTSQYARVLVGSMLRKGVNLELPDNAPEGAKEWLLHKFTADNKSIHSFLDEAMWEEIQTSRAWVLVDYPQVMSELSQDESEEIYPYPRLLRAESVINWKEGTHPIKGTPALTQVICRYYTQNYEENEFHPTYTDTVVVYDLPDGYLRVRIYERKKDDENVPIINGEVQQYYNVEGGGFKGSGKSNQWELKSTNINVLKNGERLDFIPLWPLNGQCQPSEPMLQPLIDREIGLYNKVSRRNHLLYGAATYTPVVASDMSDEEFEELVSAGLGSWLRVREGEKITALETPTNALKDMEQAINNTIDEMSKMGIRLLSPEGNSSGVALEIRNAAQTGLLGNLNTRVSITMAEIIAFMLNWKYGTDYTTSDIKFMLSGDFNPAPLGSDWMRLVTEWYQAGLIPRATFLDIAKQNDIIPNDYDDKEAISEIEEDDLIVPVREQFDVNVELRQAKATGTYSETGYADSNNKAQGGATIRPLRERTKPVNDGSISPER